MLSSITAFLASTLKKRIRFDESIEAISYNPKTHNFSLRMFLPPRESFYALGLRVITRNFGCNANYRASTRYGILKA